MPLAKVDALPLREHAYRILLRAIVCGDLAPGERLRDQELARQLALSRTPVREALQRLADEGLVEMLPRSHTRVTSVDPATAAEAFAVVAALHALAARLALPRWEAADAQRLAAANRRLSRALRQQQAAEAIAADDEFHGVFVDRAGNHELKAALQALMPKVRRLEWLQFSSLAARQSVAQHRLIAAAARRGDPDVSRAVEDNWLQLGALVSAAMAHAGDAPGVAPPNPPTPSSQRPDA